ncbi:MAG: UvrD-helicase domain-containing protein, partial [Dehalococcoidia bacterium]
MRATLATVTASQRTFLHDLNPAQRQAASHPGGALLILAGPGSGKTRVIAHRIAYLVRELSLPPWQVLAVTFTNKAARELRARVEALLDEATAGMTLGTFHSVCSRILRADG